MGEKKLDKRADRAGAMNQENPRTSPFGCFFWPFHWNSFLGLFSSCLIFFPSLLRRQNVVSSSKMFSSSNTFSSSDTVSNTVAISDAFFFQLKHGFRRGFRFELLVFSVFA